MVSADRRRCAMANTATLPARRAPERARSVSVGERSPAASQLGHFRIDRPARRRRHGRGLPRDRPRARSPGRDQGAARRLRDSGAARDRTDPRGARAGPRRSTRTSRTSTSSARTTAGCTSRWSTSPARRSPIASAKGPLPVEEALVDRSAPPRSACARPSAPGFTHRDVKPSNLMVDAHGIVKVLDFGLAAATPERARDGPVAQTSLAGTPLYMAPEQARGEPIDFRADIYALGATLYHLVSGRPPFEADTVDELMSLHATAARPHVPRRATPRTAVAAVDRADRADDGARPERSVRDATTSCIRAIELASTQHTRPAGLWVRAIASLIDVVARQHRCSRAAMLPFSGRRLRRQRRARDHVRALRDAVPRALGHDARQGAVRARGRRRRHEPPAYARRRAFVREVTLIGPMLATSIVRHLGSSHLDATSRRRRRRCSRARAVRRGLADARQARAVGPRRRHPGALPSVTPAVRRAATIAWMRLAPLAVALVLLRRLPASARIAAVLRPRDVRATAGQRAARPRTCRKPASASSARTTSRSTAAASSSRCGATTIA